MIRLDLNQFEVTTFAVREPEEPAACSRARRS
jgi:hypothetical protein